MRLHILIAVVAISLTLGCAAIEPGLSVTEGPDGTPQIEYSSEKHAATLMVEGLEVLAMRYDVDIAVDGLQPLGAFFEQLFAECGSVGTIESVSLLFVDRHSAADMLEESAIDNGQSPREFVEMFAEAAGAVERLLAPPLSALCQTQKESDE